MEKMYIIDRQDIKDFAEVTLEEARGFLLSLWEDSDYEFDSIEEHADFLTKIETADKDSLKDMLLGCDYEMLYGACIEDAIIERLRDRLDILIPKVKSSTTLDVAYQAFHDLQDDYEEYGELSDDKLKRVEQEIARASKHLGY